MDLDFNNQKLDNIANAISLCQKCRLSKTRNKTVPGSGISTAKIMFIGEAPGANEDKEGIPFCGAAGKFLDLLLNSIDLDREKVFIANTVKCRPPGNRDPEQDEKDLCWPYLAEQIEIINPKIIVTLGKHATERFLPGIGGISKLRAKLFRRSSGRYFFPLYHPAAALHNGALRQTLLDDFAKLKGALKKVEEEEDKNNKKLENLQLF